MSVVNYTYPRGFSLVGSAVNGESRVSGDPEVTRLYREMLDNPMLTKNWKWMRDAFIVGKRLIGNDFGEWVSRQESNPYLNDMGIRFVADTIKFVTEGKREISVIGWLAALTNEPAMGMVRDRKFHLSKDHIAASKGISIFFIRKWLQKPGGFIDFMTTLYIAYGEHDKTYVNKSSGKNAVMVPQIYAELLLRQKGIDKSN
jgi:hypothetical protein